MSEHDDFVVDEAGQKYLLELRERLLRLATESEDVDYDPSRRGGGGSCPTGYWRGHEFCLHTIVKLSRGLAPNTGSLYIKPIQGSYTYATANSAGTHGGGGAGDVAHGSWSETQDNSVMNIARDEAYLIYWDRDAISGVWSDHGHFVDPSCPNLSPEAAAQVVDFHYGRNGLANDGPDFGSRKRATTLWNMYLNRSRTTVASIEALFPEPAPTPTPTPAPVPPTAEEFPMDTETRAYYWNQLIRYASGDKAVIQVIADLARDADGTANKVAVLDKRLQTMEALLTSVANKVGAVVPEPSDPEPSGPVNPWSTVTGPAYGVDTSGHQTIEHVKSIIAGTAVPGRSFKFAIEKATEGKGFRNDLYDEHMALYRQATWLTGAYHFHWPTNPVELDFANFVATSKLRLGEIVMLDAENWDSRNGYADMKNLPSWLDRLKWDLAWLRLAKAHYGCNPWIYLNWNWIKEYRIASGQAVRNADGTVTVKPATQQTALWKELTSYPLMLAAYSGVGGQHDTVDGGWNAGIVCHQFTDTNKTLDQNYISASVVSDVWWRDGIKTGVAA